MDILNLAHKIVNAIIENDLTRKHEFEVIEFTYGAAVYNVFENKWYDLILLNGQEIALDKLNVDLTGEGIIFKT